MMKRHETRGWLAGISLCLLWILSGCASRGTPFAGYRDPDWQPLRTMRVAVLPLENLTAAPNAGVVMAQLLSAELHARSLFQQSGEEEVRRLVTGNPVEKDRRGGGTLREVGEKLQVEAIFSGSVSEFSYQHGLREEPVVGLRLSLIRVQDGRVLWQAGHALRGSGPFQRDTLIATAQHAIRDLVELLAAPRPAS